MRPRHCECAEGSRSRGQGATANFEVTGSVLPVVRVEIRM